MSPSTSIDSGKKVISPSKFAHVVLRTNNFEPMVDFYTTFLGGRVNFRHDPLAFITYDEEHHRVAILHVPTIADKARQTNGLEHMAFTYDSLRDLARSWQQRRAHGIDSVWQTNHGPTTSIYYKDPDGNIIETQVDNMSNDDANDFMRSEAFRENPFGTDFEVSDLIRRLESGEDEASIMKRREVGARGIETVPLAE